MSSLIARRRAKLHKLAFALGEKIYASSKPARLADAALRLQPEAGR